MKRALYIVLILIALGLGYLKFHTQDVPPSPMPSPFLPSPTPLASVQTLTTAYFSLEYPSDATASPVTEGPDNQTWAFSYMGETQRASGRTQTELFDGYALTITRFQTSSSDDAIQTQAQADMQGISDACGESHLTTLAPTLIAGHEAQNFTGGCLGEATYYYFLDSENLYRLTVMIVGPETSTTTTYQEIVDQIISSLKFAN